MDRLASMEVFVKVAEQGSFSAAARALGLSKSAVSKHVTALEERLGVRLLNRTTRRLALTEVGFAYRHSAARLVAEIDEVETLAGRHSVEPRGRLKIAAPVSFAITRLAPLLPEFLARHPHLEVELSLNDRFVDLLEEGFDLAVRVGTLRDSSLIARRLALARMVCVASPPYLERRGVPQHPDDLRHHACLRYTYGRNPDVWEFRRGGERVTVKVGGPIAANNGEVLVAAAVGGLGIVCPPDFIGAGELERGRLVPILSEWTIEPVPVHAVFPPQRQLSAKLRVLIDYLVERLDQRPPEEDRGQDPAGPGSSG